jgi:hypothetical protein
MKFLNHEHDYLYCWQWKDGMYSAKGSLDWCCCCSVILKRQIDRAWTGLTWLRIEISGEWRFRATKMLGITWLVEELLLSQEGLGSLEMVTTVERDSPAAVKGRLWDTGRVQLKLDLFSWKCADVATCLPAWTTVLVETLTVALLFNKLDSFYATWNLTKS